MIVVGRQRAGRDSSGHGWPELASSSRYGSAARVDPSLTQAAAKDRRRRSRAAGGGHHWSREGRDSFASHVALIDYDGRRSDHSIRAVARARAPLAALREAHDMRWIGATSRCALDRANSNP